MRRREAIRAQGGTRRIGMPQPFCKKKDFILEQWGGKWRGGIILHWAGCEEGT